MCLPVIYVLVTSGVSCVSVCVLDNDKCLPEISVLITLVVWFDYPAGQVGILLGTLLLRLEFFCLFSADQV